MGSIIEINDTLQITREQGFPVELDLNTHLVVPLKVESFSEKIFGFSDKQGVRVYQQAPVRNFLVENRDGKWIYWGLIQVLEINHANGKTSGTFKLTYIYTPEEMKKAHELIDRNPETRYDF